MKTSEHLNAAADYLEKNGWRQGRYRDEDGKCCTVGALIVTDPPHELIMRRGQRALSKHIGRGVLAWNDQPGRTAEEVISKLREAANECLSQGD